MEFSDPGYALLKKEFQQRKWTSIVSINIYIFLFSDYKDILSLWYVENWLLFSC